jgi:hypothetical protein
MTTADRSPGAGDFDFFIGHWHVEHTFLKRRLALCTDWARFTGTTLVRPTLGGMGNMDDDVLDHPDGTYRAVTLRAYDEQEKQWSIWWLDGRRAGKLDVPMVGKFQNDVGVFYADDSFDGRPIRVRFIWTKGTQGVPRWEQAFSPDGGATWETNWTMEFHPATQST